MPLTLNLLHEEQRLHKERQRDPLKLGIYALAGVAALFVLYYAYRAVESGVVTSQMHSTEAEWNKQEPLAKAAAAKEAELTSKVSGAAAVTRRIENRFYWAPFLQLLLKSVPPNVQIINFGGSNDSKSDKITVVLEGLAAGDVPRFAAEQFRTSLNDRLSKQYQAVSSTFKGLDETASTVPINGKATPTARFSIEVSMAKPAAMPEPTPVPERRPKKSS